METIKHYVSLWITMTARTTQIALYSRSGILLFSIGKLVRFGFFVVFLLLLTSRTNTLAGYTVWQVMLFFITFTFLDSISQFLWREVYRFRQYIISGNFDYYLTKPISPLFRSLFGGSDILDLLTLVPLSFFLVYVLLQIGNITLVNVLLYILMLLNGLLIMLSFHIFVLGLGIVTTEVENAISMFREITQLGRFPLTVYPKTVSLAFTFVLPIAAMIAVPTEALLGIVSFQGIVLAFLFSGMFLFASLKFWQYALKKYASASS